MALEVASGSWAFPSSNVNAWHDVVTNLSFTPKFVKIWAMGVGTSDGETSDNRGFIGLSDGTNMRMTCWYDNSNDAEGDSHTRWSATDTVYMFNDDGSGVLFQASTLDFSPSTGTGFRIYVTDLGAGEQIFWEAYGGSDIEEIKVGDFETDDTSATQDVTDPGISNLDAVLFFSPLSNVAVDTRVDDGKLCVGFTDFTDNYYVNFAINDDDVTSQAHSAQGNDGCIADTNPGGGTLLSRSQCKTKITNGFRLDHDDRWEYANVRVLYVAIKGPKFKAIKVNSRTTNGNIVTTGVGFQPKAIDMVSMSHGSYASAVNDAIFNYGTTVDGTIEEEHCASGTTEDSQATTDASSRTNSTKVHQIVDENNNVESLHAMTSFDNDGWTMTQSASSGASVDFIMCFCWGSIVRPSVVNVSSDKDNGTYGVDEEIYIQVCFDDQVAVTGTPQLDLDVVGGGYDINYVAILEPDDIITSGLEGWYDSSDTDSITKSGDDVTQWNDKSGNNRHVKQSAGSSAPHSGTRTQNGLNAIDFDDTTYQVLDTDGTCTWLNSTAYTVIAAIKPDDTGGNYLCGNGQNSDNKGLHIGFRDGSNWTIAHYGDDYDISETEDTNPHIFVSQYKSPGCEAWKDGTSIGSSGTAPASDLSTDSGVFQIGAGWDTTSSANAFDGLICEVIVVSSAIGQTDREKLEGYLAWKWGLTANLPALHPYKNRPPLAS